MKLLTVVGARPQFVKAAIVSPALRELNIQEDLVHTGQHYDPKMSQAFFDEMKIPEPAVNLHIGSGSHAFTTAEMLKGIEKEILSRKPDLVLVYGDTNSTLAGALAAAKLHVPIAHIEAGMRSFNRKMPEELNRILTDHCSDILFTCSEKTGEYLKHEGITKNIFNVGDVMFDAFLQFIPRAHWPKELSIPSSPFALATIHRAQNTDELDRFDSLLRGLSELNIPVILPLHPRSLKVMTSNGFDKKLSRNVHVVEPLPYLSLLGVLKDCSFVLTDSGGLQKEAYYAGKRAVVLRDETEWTELIDEGVNQLTGVEPSKILAASKWAMQSTKMPKNIYGDGSAGKKIASHILNYIKNQ